MGPCLGAREKYLGQLTYTFTSSIGFNTYVINLKNTLLMSYVVIDLNYVTSRFTLTTS